MGNYPKVFKAEDFEVKTMQSILSTSKSSSNEDRKVLTPEDREKLLQLMSN